MADINLDGLSLPEAEEAIAEIWSCLEEYDIPSPVVSVEFRDNSRMTVGFSFAEPIWADLVSLRLSTSMRGNLPQPAAPEATTARGICAGQNADNDLYGFHLRRFFAAPEATPAIVIH
jgi:hypothetical protein